MTRATWDDAGLRLFHTGVDHGMLYTGDLIPLAVPWSGLASVTEASVGSDPSPYYLDGQKILNLPTGENFAGTIEAFSSPDEFAPCAGRGRLSIGLFATDQPRQKFGFSYRTLVGNDLKGTAFAYKIHIVYNATAQVSNFVHTTLTNDPSPKTSTWAFTTVPEVIPGFKPTSHVVFDTRHVDQYIIAKLEDILYGNADADPRLPTADELLGFLITPPGTAWWDVTSLSDFPGGAVTGDSGIDFTTADLYADVAANNTAYLWDLTGGADFPAEAVVGDWGLDQQTGDIYQMT
jgi:hypothetical protein